MSKPAEQDDSHTHGTGTSADTEDVKQQHEPVDNPEQHGEHPTGERQAAENAENELPG